MHDGPKRLAERLLNLFGPPQCDDPAAYLAEVADALKGYDWDTCMAIGTMARDQCQFFPRIAELHHFANAAVRDREFRSRKPYEPEPERPPPTPEQCAVAAELVRRAKEAMAAHAMPKEKWTDPDWKAGQRPGFEKMQRESPNHGLHRAKGGRLTDLSRRMSGDDA